MPLVQGLRDAGLFLFALVAMEGVAWATHRFLMHGPLWALHRSHHEPRLGRFELNDLFALYFALPSMAMIIWGRNGWPPAGWIGWGMTGYGVIYALFHDGLVHGRFRSPLPPRPMKRLVQAHRLHHVVTTKHGAVSYGFLWAPPARRLAAQLKAGQGRAAADGRSGGPSSGPGGGARQKPGRKLTGGRIEAASALYAAPPSPAPIPPRPR